MACWDEASRFLSAERNLGSFGVALIYKATEVPLGREEPRFFFGVALIYKETEVPLGREEPRFFFGVALIYKETEVPLGREEPRFFFGVALIYKETEVPLGREEPRHPIAVVRTMVRTTRWHPRIVRTTRRAYFFGEQWLKQRMGYLGRHLLKPACVGSERMEWQQ